MPEENEQDDKLEDEMLKMMQEEGENAGEAAAGDAAGEEDASESPSDSMEAELLSAMMQETESEPAAVGPMAGPATFVSTSVPPSARRLQDVRLSVTIELGHCVQPIATLLEWTEGSLIELDKLAGDAVDVLVNGRPFAKGEVVTIAENFGVRVTEILPTHPRLAK